MSRTKRSRTERKTHPSPACQAIRPLRNVVVGTALDESSDAVLRAAWEVARTAEARLHVIHATEMVPTGSDFHDDWVSPEALESALSHHKTLLGEQLERLHIEPGKLGSWHVESNAPHQVLLRAAERVSADLVVVGASRTGRLGRLLGSTADRVTRRATCPVLVVRGALHVPPRSVLAPVDLSELSADAMVCGLALLEHLAGDTVAETEVEALHVLDLAAVGRPEDLTPAELEEAGQQSLDRFLEEHGGAVAPEIRPVLTTGEAREQILHRLEEHPVDLVLLSTHGRSGFERLLLGSVAAEVVRRAPLSVLMVPPPAALGTCLAEAVAAETAPVWREETPAEVGKRSAV